MENNYTSNQLVQFIYGEATFAQYFELDDAMERDPALRTEFRYLYDSFSSLPEIKMGPSKTTVNNILELSKA